MATIARQYGLVLVDESTQVGRVDETQANRARQQASELIETSCALRLGGVFEPADESFENGLLARHIELVAAEQRVEQLRVVVEIEKLAALAQLDEVSPHELARTQRQMLAHVLFGELMHLDAIVHVQFRFHVGATRIIQIFIDTRVVIYLQ